MKYQKGFTLMELMVAIAALVSLAISGFVVYALFHFAAKFW